MPMTILATIDPASSRVRATDSRGHSVAMDTSPPIGEDTAPGPKELVLAALAGCGAMDVASLLRKKRQSATAYEVAVSAESAEEHPRVFTSITVEHRVMGAVEPEALRRSVELSSTRYCPVSAMLSASVRIEHWYRLTGADGREQHALVAVTGPEGSQVL
ncbi:MAG TPA: OsmC family protein [Candidatus Limnocylindria bacterium]|nr:OsmC family protein [Candidatus Limnocylindria bacterium]